jgi:hypothetical protein
MVTMTGDARDSRTQQISRDNIKKGHYIIGVRQVVEDASNREKPITYGEKKGLLATA